MDTLVTVTKRIDIVYATYATARTIGLRTKIDEESGWYKAQSDVGVS
ncbi:hypothetical protein [Xenorhabdus ehlersii]|nr:hypothetical protein [Xenorhabdus ehlersii]